jgi:hypothetical protein
VFSSCNVLLNIGSKYKNCEKRYEIISNMEVEAYRMQYSYDGSFPGKGNKLSDIDVHSVGRIMNGNTPVYYPIYQYSRFLRERNNITNK